MMTFSPIIIFLILILTLLCSSQTTAQLLDHHGDPLTSDACSDHRHTACRVIPHCKNGQQVFNNYWLTHVPSGVWQAPPQQTKTTVCHDGANLVVEERATDAFPIVAHRKCNDDVWNGSSALEMFVSRVATPYDIPMHYYEIDPIPNNVAFGALIESKKGNVTTCATCKVANLTCTNPGTFPDFPTHKITTTTTEDGWKTTRTVPFSMFDQFIHAEAPEDKNTFFRANFYRYDYPQGKNGSFVLSGANPTWSPSFHVPSRMVLFVLIDL